MKILKFTIGIFVLYCLLGLVFPAKALAYLGLGAGSYMIQLVVATFLGGLFAIKLFWNNIKEFFKKMFSKRKK